MSSVISGALIAPFLALVVTLVYYRLAGESPVPQPPGDGGGYGEYQGTTLGAGRPP